jgi:hypothetical protein
MSSPIGSPLPKPGVERQPVWAVDVHEVLPHLGRDRPFAQEGDLVEPAALAGQGVPDYGGAPLPGAQLSVGLPLDLDRVGAAVVLDGGAVGDAERFLVGGTDVLVEAAGEQPPLAFEPLDDVRGYGLEHGAGVRHTGHATNAGCLEAGEEHQAGELERVAELMVHAHGLVSGPFQG